MIRALGEQRVEYVIIGGVALAMHGSAYLTNDLDIAYERSAENVARLVAALKPLHPRLRVGAAGEELEFVFDARTIQNGMNFTLATDAGNIDLLGRVAGFDSYGELKGASGSLAFDDGTVAVLTIDGLLRSKKASGRTKDQLVLPELEALREARPD